MSSSGSNMKVRIHLKPVLTTSNYLTTCLPACLCAYLSEHCHWKYSCWKYFVYSWLAAKTMPRRCLMIFFSVAENWGQYFFVTYYQYANNDKFILPISSLNDLIQCWIKCRYDHNLLSRFFDREDHYQFSLTSSSWPTADSMNGTLKHLTQRSKKLEYIKGTVPAALLNCLAPKSHFPQKIKICAMFFCD